MPDEHEPQFQYVSLCDHERKKLEQSIARGVCLGLYQWSLSFLFSVAIVLFIKEML